MLREHGFAGLTQPRVAKLVGMRQSLLTYYYPTRVDLLAAVGRTAVDRQLAAVRGMFGTLASLDEAAAAISVLITRHENTRVLMALAQAGDQEPQLRALFRELAEGIATEVTAFLVRMGGQPPAPHAARLLHATSVGLAVVTLATGQDDGQAQARLMLRDLLSSLVPDTPHTSSTSSVPPEGEAA